MKACCAPCLVVLVAACAPSVAQAQGVSAGSGLVLPEEARAGLELLYRGDTQQGAVVFRRLQARQPDHPLGYLLEANAVWWERWCGSLEISPGGFIEAPEGQAAPQDEPYLALVAMARNRADAHLNRDADMAEAHFYQGLAHAMEGRVQALRGENLAAASAGKRMRASLLRARALNPGLDDALFGLGLYNYYVATLSPLVKLLRILLFIPGGDRQTGMEQLESAAANSQLVATEARFWLAKNLRNYDRNFARARAEFERLRRRYPQSPVFTLLVAGTAQQAGDFAAARRAYNRVRDLARGSSPCAQRPAELSAQGLEQLPRRR